MRKNTWLSLLLVLALLISLCPAVYGAASARHSGNDPVRVIVPTQSQPTAENRTFVQRFLNTDARLLREHSAVRQRMTKQNIDYTVNFEYTALLNGMSLTVDSSQLDEVAAIPGVSQVIVARTYRLPKTRPSSTTASEIIGAGLLRSELAADGSGKVIAILDTGITADHEAFGVYDGMLLKKVMEAQPADILIFKAVAFFQQGYHLTIVKQGDYLSVNSWKVITLCIFPEVVLLPLSTKPEHFQATFDINNIIFL